MRHGFKSRSGHFLAAVAAIPACPARGILREIVAPDPRRACYNPPVTGAPPRRPASLQSLSVKRSELHLPPLPRPVWVDDEDTLLHLEDHLRASNALIGIDIETTLAGQHHCVVALVQLSDGESVWLLDPLVLDLGPILRLLFSAPWIPPIFHDASGDLMVLKRLYGTLPEGVIDTLIAAQVLGLTTPNLRYLTEFLLGWKMSKQPQQSNWLRRPLSDAQIEYAALDVFALPYIERDLRGHLADFGLEEEFQQACAALMRRMDEYRPPRNHPFEDRFFRRTRDEAARRCLRRLLDWRTAEANRGRIDVLMAFGNEQLADIALARPRTLRELDECARIPARMLERYGKQVLREIHG